ncbi:MAG: Formamidopyrimidine-DNA glycosylase [Candidatus Collierbacteria bacterium GW2011_GWC2_44_18]|uniref:Formamidopyrimidine-DNA glycosylase n=1 Tax=Candidatus Collierbacteria bacterium GW2011_GWC2_44_18 TaxID=1618392 RepID=A0A0G1JYE1_9BACT|nr:MAG: Formamidopyrimidine-DNA glycosylase [Candidatus Levybacteria bacterium GW2011_GWA2_37_36]KKT30568.1 MAG: Formamidopyrimidine-DNA glycosylase [Microgenomates group bacterium GW2011_GWC1_44_10]KKT48922.1 MAG: Formamidopyrimidine-DNA glycosylase [Candidatus Collierbacteria bacterium GW2011_GWC2_44_18]
MPELPEVETISRQLNESISGCTVSQIEVLRQRSFLGDEKKIIDWKVESVSRKSKVIGIRFSNQTEMVIVHLKMTGQLIFVDGMKRIVGGHPTPDWVNELPSKHTRVIWTFKEGSKLYFNDMRVFGWMKIVSKEKYEKEIRKQSPDIIDQGFTDKYLFDILKKTKKAIKLVLLDQEKMGGLGNIYVNDALFLAGIRPDRKADSLSWEETRQLHKAVVRVILDGIKYGGASASNYVHVSGLGGTYQDHFQVYKKDGQKCPKCGEIIKKIKLGGRGTFFCPNCQM